MSTKLNQWWRQWLITADEVTSRTKSALRSPSRTINPPPALQLSGLEPRVLFSATPIDPNMMPGAEEAAMVVEVETASADSTTPTTETLAEEAPVDQAVRELIVIDSAVSDLDQLLDDLNASGRAADLFVLDSERDGIDQITEILEGRSDVLSVHLVTHAEDGAVKLGNLWLGDANLAGYAGQIASWQSALATDADILFYGCELAESDDGRMLLDTVSALTGADVAASVDDTGHAKYGGDWDLEYTTGQIETSVAFSHELRESWNRKLSIITVTTTADEISSNGQMSLREAILQANAGGGGDTIVLGAGTYTLSLGSRGENGALEGDLDIATDVTISGANARSTIIDGGGIDRVFEVTSVGDLTLSGVTVRNGDADSANGGAIFLAGGSSIASITDVALLNNQAADGGAIYNNGTLTLNRVLMASNAASDDGGGLMTVNADTTLINVTMTDNSADWEGAAIWTNRVIDVTNSTIAYNTGTAAAVHGQGSGNLRLKNSILSNNSGGNSDKLLSSQGHNIEDGSSAFAAVGGDQQNTDPGLGSLANNGGQTDTFAISSSSNAFNAGTATDAPAVDQRGFTRDATPDVGAYEFVANSLVVDTFSDIVDATDLTSVSALLSNRGADGFISLREAIIAINADTGARSIILDEGTYVLSIAGDGENHALTGDLDIDQDITLIGVSAATTIIDGGGIDRVFELRNDHQVRMQNLTVQGGDVSGDGGGILVGHSNAQLSLERVIVSGNSADSGAGVFNDGTIALTDVWISGNGDQLLTSEGGGIHNGGDAVLNRVTLSGNEAVTGRGSITTILHQYSR